MSEEGLCTLQCRIAERGAFFNRSFALRCSRECCSGFLTFIDRYVGVERDNVALTLELLILFYRFRIGD